MLCCSRCGGRIRFTRSLGTRPDSAKGAGSQGSAQLSEKAQFAIAKSLGFISLGFELGSPGLEIASFGCWVRFPGL